ncbi:MAG: flagellar biosynthesis protein FlhF, partial [Panacagrimonas sp.]
LKAEMQTMRRFMEQQLAIITRGEPAAPRHPIRADVVRALIDLGVESKLAREIASEISEGVSSERARQQALGVLARRIPAFKHEWLDAGGVVALVGATGVGKTTSVAKLAARYVQSWGLRNVALITTDHFRIGAQEQLFTYGRLLGVPVLTADTPNELRLALDKLRDCKLVLIDTAGMSPRDANLEKQFAMLSSLPTPARTALVLSAGSQAGDLDAQFTRFAPANPSAVILTKLDEATRIGSAFSALARRDVPLAYVADGQRVPEDLCAARPEDLVRNAAEALRRDQATHQQTQAEVELDGVAHA